ncbi:hypothetical protein fugu_019907 [Takifugu bimaculatus]|uniref:Secreted protein n=1 Tax=Takifugu bimaculatus TaxID=433685 RepID=A0A4Z2BIF2_9TELE|nr:hypothetical protein fugu_019907 [Takifugu bimaculatus]
MVRLALCRFVCLTASSSTLFRKGVRTVFNYHPADLLYTVDLRVSISPSSFYIHCCMMSV